MSAGTGVGWVRSTARLMPVSDDGDPCGAQRRGAESGNDARWGRGHQLDTSGYECRAWLCERAAANISIRLAQVVVCGGRSMRNWLL